MHLLYRTFVPYFRHLSIQTIIMSSFYDKISNLYIFTEIYPKNDVQIHWYFYRMHLKILIPNVFHTEYFKSERNSGAGGSVNRPLNSGPPYREEY